MVEPLSHQALSELIGSIYDCTLDPDRWEGTLAEIGDTLAQSRGHMSWGRAPEDTLMVYDRSG